MNIPSFTDQSWATLIAAVIVIFAGIWQLRWNLRQNKKSDAFNELSKGISEAKICIRDIQTNSNQLIYWLANKADAILRGEEGDDVSLSNAQKENIQAIFDSQRRMIEIIEMIDKSTVISRRIKNAAKQLYYLSMYQHDLVVKCNQIVQAIVKDVLADPKDLVSPDVFKNVSELYGLVVQGSVDIQSYLDDLEIILHNGLVKFTFGKASTTGIERKVLTIDGIVDTRIKRPLR